MLCNPRSSSSFECLETLLKDAGDVVGFAHCVEVDGWGAVGDEILALHCAPLCTDLIYSGFVVACLRDFLCELKRNVE